MKPTKITALILAALMTFSAVGCGNNTDTSDGKDTGKDTSANIDTTAETELTRANTPDSLPDDLDFGGETINIFYFGLDDSKNFDAVGEMGGDIVLDSVYQRNLRTEERLNVTLNWIEGSSDWGEFPNEVSNALMAGVSDYDLIMEENSQAFRHTLRGYFVNLKDAKYIDIDQPWWYSEMMQEGSIDNNKRYYITGDLTMTTLFGASAVFFNKSVYTDYFGDVNDIYNHVLDGTWTYDVFAEYCKGVYTDLNANQTADAGDLFGFEYEQWGIPNYMSMSTGLTYSKRDSDGLPVIDLYTEESVLWGQTLYKLLYSDNMSRLSSSTEKVTSFLNSKTLFLVSLLGSATQLRDSSFEYGILPYPKLSETLGYMSAAATVNGNAVAIPVAAPPAKFDATCAAVESLCAEAYRNVVPTWYDTALKIKYLDTEIDAQMVDVIYDHIASSFIMMADKEMGIGSVFTNAVFGAGNDGAFAAFYAKNEKSYQKKWEAMIKTYQELES